MKADALLRVTVALRDRLTAALTTSGVPGAVFVGPLDDPDASGAPLVLFLYRVVPNIALRNHERRVPSTTMPGQAQVFLNALPLDLYYLLTVGTTPGASEEILLQALGFAMQALQDDPIVTGAGVSHEIVRVTLEPLSTEEASRIWTLFPTANYRTSVAYLATPVWIDPSGSLPAATPVTEDRLLAGPKAVTVMP